MSLELPPARLCALKYDKLFQNFSSESLDYDSVFSVKQKSIGVVEFRQVLTSERKACLDRNVHSENAEFVMNRCTKYMGALLYMKENEQSLQQAKKPIRVRSSWTSAMAPYGVFGRPQRFTTNGLVSEEMTLIQVRWLAAAWQRAQQQLAALGGQQGDGSGAAAPPSAHLDAAKVTACLELLRGAAGAADYLADTQIPHLQAELDGKELPRVPEVQQWFHRCVSKVLLAQAQALFAHNAECKGSAATLTVALFIGASDLLEEAVQMINAAEATDDPTPCDDFKKYIVLNSTLALTRARRLMAGMHLEAREAGRASVAAKHAENELAQCAYVAEGNSSWSADMQVALAEAEAVWKHYDGIRWNVYCEPPSRDPPNKLPNGRTVMTAIAFTPPREDYALDFESV